MNEQVDKATYEFLGNSLANPADPDHTYTSGLRSLVARFPQSGLLHALLASTDIEYLKHAAVHFDPRVLSKLANGGSLPVVTAEQIVYISGQKETSGNVHDLPLAEPETGNFETTEDLGNTPDTDQPLNTFAEEETAKKELPVDTDTSYNTFAEPEADDEQPVEGFDSTDETTRPIAETATDGTNTFGSDLLAEMDADEKELVSSYKESNYFHQEIEDEVYDEIVSIEDISLEQLAMQNSLVEPEAEPTPVALRDSHFAIGPELAEKAVEDEEDAMPGDEPVHEAADEAEEDRSAQTIPNDRYFVFEPAGSEAIKAADPETFQATYDTADDSEKSTVSKYNDDKMPYTFMWWLDKTRKEHEYIYQPYVSNKVAVHTRNKKKEVVDELQQQYFEHIVSTASIKELDQVQKQLEPDQPVNKEQQIIARFIKEEPQIKHPSGVKLNNENKARRSSEDKEELVTETLARIYTEQMLYHKAILTYKKLMLKFPEKSLYFAGQIEQLESKIN